ncbi:MAG: DUF1648 domain-containing protein [Dysgonamonadaceae bacterium]|jgi:hypothetical protein|nr:DUF1648 domain-containing protein [Dysgonamonadaceae bacterium]
MNTLTPALYCRIIEMLSLATLIWTFVPLCFYGELAGVEIPVHYNVNGKIDKWGSRDYLWILSLIAAAFYVVLSVIQKYPQLINRHVKIKIRNAGILSKRDIQMMRIVKFFLIAFIAYFSNSSYVIAVGGKTSCAYIMALTAGVLISVLVFFIMEMVRLKKQIRI